MTKIASSDFMTRKHILNLTFFVYMNNVYTLIRVCWIWFLNQFWQYRASKLTLKSWKSSKKTRMESFLSFFENVKSDFATLGTEIVKVRLWILTHHHQNGLYPIFCQFTGAAIFSPKNREFCRFFFFGTL